MWGKTESPTHAKTDLKRSKVSILGLRYEKKNTVNPRGWGEMNFQSYCIISSNVQFSTTIKKITRQKNT